MTGLRQLTHDGKLKLAPVFTSGGQEIVYSVHEGGNVVALWRLRLADGSLARVHPALTAHQFDAAFSPDGRYHCYAMSSTSPQLVLVIQDLRAKTEAHFKPQDARAVVRHPTVAPDGRRIAFSLSDVGGYRIVAVDPGGGKLRTLTASPGINSWPAYSPDGRHIAFGSSRDGNPQVYVMNADGGAIRRLTSGPGMNMRPAWSPDGQQIAFTSNRDGNYEIYVVNAAGADVRRLTKHPERDDDAAWHPDGKQLVTVAERGGKFDLYLMDISG
jgi:TolB protein